MSDPIRQAFEEWAKAEHCEEFLPIEQGRYTSWMVQAQWEGWQAGVQWERERCARLCDAMVSAHDKADDQLIKERDAAEEWADKLAYAIGEYFGVDVGEHSNQNLPWSEAFEAIPDEPATQVQQSCFARIATLEAALRGLLQRLDEVHGDPAYKSVWAISQLHVGAYRGPTYEAALDAARRALGGES